MTLGEKILTLRKARGWSQEELAGRIGVTRQALSRWESNAAMPDTVNVVQLSDLFGVSCDYLLREGWTEDCPAAPQGAEPKEQRIVAWVVTALGAAGVLVMTIRWSIAHTNMGPFEYWFLSDLLWLYLLSWVTLAIGISEVRRGKLSAFLRSVFREASGKKIRQDLGLEEDEK